MHQKGSTLTVNLVLFALLLLGCFGDAFARELAVCKHSPPVPPQLGFPSIQDAVDFAEDGDVIRLCAETYTESNISIEGKVITIDGVSSDSSIIQAAANQLFANERVFFLSHSSVTFTDVTIRNGACTHCAHAKREGGGLFALESVVTLNNSRVTNNRAAAFGGGVFLSSGALIINSSRLDSNRSPAGHGGAIASQWHLLNPKPNLNRRIEISESIVEENKAFSGGALFTEGTHLRIDENTRIQHNSATGTHGRGGGISFSSKDIHDREIGNLVIENAVIFDNDAYEGGGLRTGALAAGGQIGSVNIKNVLFERNFARKSGGAIDIGESNFVVIELSVVLDNMANLDGGGIRASGAKVDLIDSTVHDNFAGQSGGGVKSVNSALWISRSTVSANLATTQGSGILILQGARISNSTISGNLSLNEGGAVELHPAYHKPDSTLDMINVTIANNQPIGVVANRWVRAKNLIVADNGTDCVGSMDDAGLPSLDSDGSCGFSLSNANANLGPLTNNRNAPTRTHALVPPSDAIDAGDDPTCDAPPVDKEDQTRIERPRGFHCDLGAYESDSIENLSLNMLLRGPFSGVVLSDLGICAWIALTRTQSGQCAGSLNRLAPFSAVIEPEAGGAVGQVNVTGAAHQLEDNGDGTLTIVVDLEAAAPNVVLDVEFIPQVVLAIAPLESSIPPLGSIPFSATGGDGNYTFSIATNNSGGSIDPTTGEYESGPTGDVSDTIQVTDGQGAVSTATVAVTAALQISPATYTTPPLGGTTFTATGGDGDYAFAMAANNSGGSIDPTTGEYEAGPTGGVNDTIRVTDGLGATAEATVEVVVVDAPTVVATTDSGPWAAFEFPGFRDVRLNGDDVNFLAEGFDAETNLSQWNVHHKYAQETDSIVRETGETGLFGPIDSFLGNGIFRAGQVFHLQNETKPDDSPTQALVQHIFLDGQWFELRITFRDHECCSTVESIGNIAANDPYFVVQLQFLGEGAGLVAADLDVEPVPLDVLFRAGDPVGDGFTFDAFHVAAQPGIALNHLGDGAVIADVIDPATGAAVDAVLTYRADMPGAGLLLHEDQETATPGVTISRLTDVAMDGDGVIAALGRVSGTGISSTNDEAVWVCMAALCTIAVQEGMEPDGMPGVRLRFPGSPVVRNGKLLMRTVLEGTGIDSTNNFGLLLVDVATGGIELVAQKGDVLAGKTIRDFRGKAFSNDIPLVAVLFNDFTLALGRIDSGGLVPLIAPGDEITMPDGTLGVVASVVELTETGGEDGRRSAVGGGGYAIVVNFDDGRQGIVACTAACLEGG